MDRIQEELAYQEKQDVDQVHEQAEGKYMLAVWLKYRMDVLRKRGFSNRVILNDIEFEINKVIR